MLATAQGAALTALSSIGQLPPFCRCPGLCPEIEASAHSLGSHFSAFLSYPLSSLSHIPPHMLSSAFELKKGLDYKYLLRQAQPPLGMWLTVLSLLGPASSVSSCTSTSGPSPHTSVLSTLYTLVDS